MPLCERASSTILAWFLPTNALTYTQGMTVATWLTDNYNSRVARAADLTVSCNQTKHSKEKLPVLDHPNQQTDSSTLIVGKAHHR